MAGVRLVGAAGSEQGFPGAIERIGFPARVADLPVDGKCLLVVAGGLVIIALLAEDRREPR